MFGYVSYTREHEGAQATDFTAAADFTEETAAENPDWTLDLSDQEIGHWRGTEGRRGVITLVWGVALVRERGGGHRRARADHDGPVRARRGPLHARVARRLHGRLRRGAPVRRPRRRAGRASRSTRTSKLPPAMETVRGERCVLLKFGELALKGRNRPLFVNALERNLRRLTADLGPLEVRHRGGVLIVTGDDAGGRARGALPRAARRERRAAGAALRARRGRGGRRRGRAARAAAPGAPSRSARRGATSAFRCARSSSRG